MPDHTRAPIPTWIEVLLLLAVGLAISAGVVHCEAQAAVEALL